MKLPKCKRTSLLAFFLFYLLTIGLMFLYYIYAYDLNNELTGNRKAKKLYKNSTLPKYIIEIKEHKLNKLFEILQDKEKQYGHLLDELDLVSFAQFANNKKTNSLGKYSSQAEKYLMVNGNRVMVNEQYVTYLKNKSEYFLTASSRSNIQRKKILNVNFFSSLYKKSL